VTGVADATERQKLYADTMTSGEMAEHRGRNGLLLLPVGCFEMHGYQAGMSTDSVTAQAASEVFAREWDGVILPTVHYTFPGASGPWPGTVSISPRDTIDYLLAVVRAILRNGFKKVVVVSSHGPNSSVLQMVFRTLLDESGELPIHIGTTGDFYTWVEEEYGHNHREAAKYLAALYMLGRLDEFDPEASEDELAEGPTFPCASYGRLRRRRVGVAYYFLEPNQHVGRYPGLTRDDAPRLAERWKQSLLTMARGLPEDYEAFQQDMWAAMAEEPWREIDET
jgi:creatinine amidohydrolase